MPTIVYNNPTGFDIGLANNVNFGYESDSINNLSAYLDFTATQYCIAMGDNYISGVAEWSATNNTNWVLYEFNQSSQTWMPFGVSGNINTGYITSITCEESTFDVISGCTDNSACNYNPNATTNDDSCWYPPENYNCDGQFIGLECISHNQCNDGWFCHSGFGPPDGFGGSQYRERYCVEYYNGYCTDNMCGIGDGDCEPGECDDGECGVDNCGSTFYDQGITTQSDCCEVVGVPGCIDADACNYNSDANTDDGSCTYEYSETCYCDTDEDGFYNYTELSNSACEGEHICAEGCYISEGGGIPSGEIYGCTDPDANNYDDNATEPCADCCIYPIEGCMDSGACNYNPDAIVEGSCIVPQINAVVPIGINTVTWDYNVNGWVNIWYISPTGTNSSINVSDFFPDEIGVINYDYPEPVCVTDPSIGIIVSDSFTGLILEYNYLGSINNVPGCVSDINNNGFLDPVTMTIPYSDGVVVNYVHSTIVKIPWPIDDCSLLNTQLSQISTNWVYSDPIGDYPLEGEESFETVLGCKISEDACNYNPDILYHLESECIYPPHCYNCDGSCAEGCDLDDDGACDPEDDCVGEYDINGLCCPIYTELQDIQIDECGVCQGSGYVDCNAETGCELANVCDPINCPVLDECNECGGMGPDYDCCKSNQDDATCLNIDYYAGNGAWEESGYFCSFDFSLGTVNYILRAHCNDGRIVQFCNEDSWIDSCNPYGGGGVECVVECISGDSACMKTIKTCDGTDDCENLWDNDGDGYCDDGTDDCVGTFDECGICNGQGPDDITNCCPNNLSPSGEPAGCDGICGSGKTNDACDICNGPNDWVPCDPAFPMDGSCPTGPDVGCDGVCFSGMFFQGGACCVEGDHQQYCEPITVDNVSWLCEEGSPTGTFCQGDQPDGWIPGGGEFVDWGCMNRYAMNYDPQANTDDGSCLLFPNWVTAGTTLENNPMWYEAPEGVDSLSDVWGPDGWDGTWDCWTYCQGYGNRIGVPLTCGDNECSEFEDNVPSSTTTNECIRDVYFTLNGNNYYIWPGSGGYDNGETFTGFNPIEDACEHFFDAGFGFNVTPMESNRYCCDEPTTTQTDIPSSTGTFSGGVKFITHADNIYYNSLGCGDGFQFDVHTSAYLYNDWPTTVQCCCTLDTTELDASGDVNFDGSVNVVDIVLIVDHILGGGSFTATQIQSADLNGDGLVNVTDIVQMVSQIMNAGYLTPEQGQQIIDEVEDLIMDEAPTETQQPIIPIVHKPITKPKFDRSKNEKQTPIRPGDSVRDIDPG